MLGEVPRKQMCCFLPLSVKDTKEFKDIFYLIMHSNWARWDGYKISGCVTTVQPQAQHGHNNLAKTAAANQIQFQ